MISDSELQPEDRLKVLIPLLVAGASFMEHLDGTVIATALPTMARTFHAQAVDLNIGISAYLLALAVFIPMSGWVADRFGSRRVFAAAIIVFTVASLLCGLSDSVAMFVAMRVLQGMGGAMMVPVGRLLVLSNTPKDRLIAAVAMLTWPALIAPVLGPAVGGFLTDYASWRWIFYLNLPLGVVALIATLILVPDMPKAARRPFDWPGFALGGGGLALFMYGVERVGQAQVAWPEALGFLIAGAALTALSVRHFRKVAHPMIDLSSLQVPTFAVTIWSGGLFRIAIGAVPFLVPLLLQLGFGLNAFHAGLLTLSVFAGNLLMKVATTQTLRRFGFRRVLVVNGVLNAVTLGACAFFTAQTPIAVMSCVLFASGLFRSMQFTTLNTLAFADVAQPKMSAANTFASTATQLTMGAGVAVGAIAIRLSRTFADSVGVANIAAIEYRLAFVIIGLIAAGGIVGCLRLTPDAGDHVAQRKTLRQK